MRWAAIVMQIYSWRDWSRSANLDSLDAFVLIHDVWGIADCETTVQIGQSFQRCDFRFLGIVFSSIILVCAFTFKDFSLNLPIVFDFVLVVIIIIFLHFIFFFIVLIFIGLAKRKCLCNLQIGFASQIRYRPLCDDRNLTEIRFC